MFNPWTIFLHWAKAIVAVFLVAALVIFSGWISVRMTGTENLHIIPLALLALLPLGLAYWAFARFVRALYQVDLKDGFAFLRHRLFGRPGFRPYATIENGKLIIGDKTLQNIGGPASIVLKQDSAIVLEQSGRLTRVVKGPQFVKLEPFEKIWAIVDLHLHRWDFKVNAVTLDGIPVAYNVALKFRIGHVPEEYKQAAHDDIPPVGELPPVEVSEDDIFRAALNTWIRDAWRSEPDRLMIWIKRVVIGATEGTMRAILARYKLDDLIDVDARRDIRKELVQRLIPSLENSGVVLQEVALQDIEFKEGEVLQLWASRWRTRRDLEVKKAEAEGLADQARIREKARNEVRRELFKQTLDILKNYQGQDPDAFAHYAVISFAEMLHRTSPNVFLRQDVTETLERLLPHRE